MVTVSVQLEPDAFVPSEATFLFRLVPLSEFEFEIDHSFQAWLPSPEAQIERNVAVWPLTDG